MILLAIAALMGLTALALVVYPLLGLDRVGRADQRDGTVAAATSIFAGQASPLADDLSEGERVARQALLDVDFDYRLGNLDESDYSQLRDRYEERALLGLKARYEREEELDRAILKQLAALKADSPGTGTRRAATPPAVSPRKGAPQLSGTRTGVQAAETATAHGVSHGPRQRRRKGG